MLPHVFSPTQIPSTPYSWPTFNVQHLLLQPPVITQHLVSEAREVFPHLVIILQIVAVVAGLAHRFTELQVNPHLPTEHQYG